MGTQSSKFCCTVECAQNFGYRFPHFFLRGKISKSFGSQDKSAILSLYTEIRCIKYLYELLQRMSTPRKRYYPFH